MNLIGLFRAAITHESISPIQYAVRISKVKVVVLNIMMHFAHVGDNYIFGVWEYLGPHNIKCGFWRKISISLVADREFLSQQRKCGYVVKT